MRKYKSIFKKQESGRSLQEKKIEVPTQSEDYFNKLLQIASKNNGILPRNIRELIEKTYQATIGL